MKTLNQLGSAYEDIIGIAKTLGLSRGEPREAASLQEAWARRALISLTGRCDGALTKDECGFNKPDSPAGKYLGHYLEAGGLFDDTEWRGAVALCRKYHGQIGNCPVAVEHDHAVEARLGDALEALRKRTKIIALVGSSEPDITIEVSEDGERLLIISPKNMAALYDWRRIPSRTFNAEAGGNVIAKSDSRALHMLLCKHFAGKLCVGPKGLFVIGGAK